KGYTFYVGPELEYFYFKSNKEPEGLDTGGYFDSRPLDSASDLRRNTIFALQDMGIEVEYSHHEVAPSQHEIDLRYDNALSMSDKTMTYRIVVKISSSIKPFGLLIAFEIEIFQFRSHIKCISFVSYFLQKPFKHIPWVSLIRRMVRVHDVAEHPGHRPFARTPWEHLKRGRIRHGNHIALMDARKTLDGRSVKSHTLTHAGFQLGLSDCKGLEHPKDICEPKLNKADILFPDKS
ncbi:MAG: hypothetical protein JRG99_11540, partial [Deltaproteobacteria bacterium]|nr:hypothetical protein [Deltaproteobacteria bacterium]